MLTWLGLLMTVLLNDCKEEKLVCSVTVYGLLIAHSQYDLCLPMKYFSNFRDPPTIQVGPAHPFAELIYCILQC